MKVIVVYNGKTGFTEKYAGYIAKELACEAVSIKEMTRAKREESDVIIYGGSVMAGMIRGLDKAKESLLNGNKTAIVFAVGATDRASADVIEKIKNTNLSPEEQDRIRFFYLQGGINYEKQGFISKIMLRAMYKSLKNKADITAEETGMMEVLEKSADKTDIEYIRPLVEYVRNCCQSG